MHGSCYMHENLIIYTASFCMNVLTSTEALPRVSMFVHTWQQHLSACTMSHANTVNIMKEWWIDPPRIWRVFSPRNTRCIDVHICECTTSEIDASEFRVLNEQGGGVTIIQCCVFGVLKLKYDCLGHLGPISPPDIPP